MLKKENRLRTTYEFNKVRRLGDKQDAVFFRIYYLDISKHQEDKNTKIGIVVSNKLSKLAVVRNRTKRVFREVVRLNFEKIREGYWIVIHPKVTSLDKGYEEISTEFTKVLQNLPISR